MREFTEGPTEKSLPESGWHHLTDTDTEGSEAKKQVWLASLTPLLAGMPIPVAATVTITAIHRWHYTLDSWSPIMTLWESSRPSEPP